MLVRGSNTVSRAAALARLGCALLGGSEPPQAASVSASVVAHHKPAAAVAWDSPLRHRAGNLAPALRKNRDLGHPRRRSVRRGRRCILDLLCSHHGTSNDQRQCARQGIARSDQARLLVRNRRLCRQQGPAAAAGRDARRAVRLRRSVALGPDVRRLLRRAHLALAEDPPLRDADRGERNARGDVVVLHRLHGDVGVLLLAAGARLDGERLVRRRDLAALDDSVLSELRPRDDLRPRLLEDSLPASSSPPSTRSMR